MDKDWIQEKCGTNKPPKETPKKRPTGNVKTSVKLKTKGDYKRYVEQLYEEATALRIQILDSTCDYQAVMRKISLIESERYEKFSKKNSSKTKKETKKARSKS